MKRKIILLFVFLPVFCFAQKIDKCYTDDFTGKKTVITTWESILPSLTSVVQFRFRYEGDKAYFELVYRNGINDSVDKGNAIEFKTKDSINQLSNDKYTIIISSQNPIEILRYCGDMNFFTDSKIEKIRIHFNNGYDGFDLKPNKALLIAKSYKIFTDAIKQ